MARRQKPTRGRREMNMIDVTTLHDNERQVVVIDGLTQVFVGPESKARELFPMAFADTPPESSRPAGKRRPDRF